MDSFEMMSAESVFNSLERRRCSNTNPDIFIQKDIDAINLFFCRNLVRYVQTGKIRDSMLNLGKNCLLVDPFNLNFITPDLFSILEFYGIKLSHVINNPTYAGYVLFVPTDQFPSSNTNSPFEIFSGKALIKQLDYLLDEPLDPIKDALDLFLYYVEDTIFYNRSPKFPIYFNFFPNLLRCAYKTLEKLGWVICEKAENNSISISFPQELINTLQ